METRWLQDFLNLAEAGSFTRAAQARHSSQAAFSRRIQSLEHWLGTTLVDRSAFPTRLTAEGERFRTQAAEILDRILTSRGELQGRPVPDRVRLAIPFALATTALPAWWARWRGEDALACQVESGNVHDMVTSLVAGTVDLLVCFHSAQQPIELDPARYDRHVLRTDRLRPYAAPGSLAAAAWPGRAGHPVPLLRYPASVYFGRLVAMAIDDGPALHATTVMECEMADVLRGLALAGQGAAWLPDCAVRDGDALVPLGGEAWASTVDTVAFRDRQARRPALDRLWTRLANGTLVS